MYPLIGNNAHIQLTTIGIESTELFFIDPSPYIRLLLLSFGILRWNSSALFVIAEKFEQRDCITMKLGKYSMKTPEIIIILSGLNSKFKVNIVSFQGVEQGKSTRMI